MGRMKWGMTTNMETFDWLILRDLISSLNYSSFSWYLATT